MPKWYELQEFGSYPLHHLRAYSRRDSQIQLRYNTTPTTLHNTNYLKIEPITIKDLLAARRMGGFNSAPSLKTKSQSMDHFPEGFRRPHKGSLLIEPSTRHLREKKKKEKNKKPKKRKFTLDVVCK